MSYTFGNKYRLPAMSASLQKVYDELLFLGSDDNILDLCCGEGRFLTKNHRKFSIYGIDVDKNGLEIASHRLRASDKLIQQDITKGIPVADGFFSSIVFWRAYHYLGKKERAKVLKEIFRILRDDGILYLVADSKSDWKYVNSRLSGKDRGDLIDVSEFLPSVKGAFMAHFFSREELMAEIELAGFEIVSIEEIREGSGFSDIPRLNTYWLVKAIAK